LDNFIFFFFIYNKITFFIFFVFKKLFIYFWNYVYKNFFIGKGFNEPDDYIIRNLKETEYYQELLDKKGETAVSLRHAFLKIEEDEY